MKTKNECIEILKSRAVELQSKFGKVDLVRKQNNMRPFFYNQIKNTVLTYLN